MVRGAFLAALVFGLVLFFRNKRQTNDSVRHTHNPIRYHQEEPNLQICDLCKRAMDSFESCLPCGCRFHDMCLKLISEDLEVTIHRCPKCRKILQNSFD